MGAVQIKCRPKSFARVMESRVVETADGEGVRNLPRWAASAEQMMPRVTIRLVGTGTRYG